jgi:tetratricopeptide (TPR) repeat protein
MDKDKALVGASAARARVFISYSRKDLAFADKLDAALKARNFESLIDRSEIYALEDWWKRIEALITRADTVVFVLSPDAVASEVALKEVVFAASLNKRFAPIVCRRVDGTAVPDAIRKLNFIYFDEPARFEESADRLAEALTTDIGWIRRHTEFGEQARRWAATKAKGLLLRASILEDAERWIAARPANAPAPTEETQAFVRESKQAQRWRRNILTASLAAGLVLALVLAGLAYWQRGVAQRNEALAQEQRVIAQKNEARAKAERDRAERNFKLAQKTADSLVVDIAHGLRDVQGMRAEAVRKILETSRATFEQLATSAASDPSLQRSRASMLIEFGNTYLTLGDLGEAFRSYRDSLTIREGLLASNFSDTELQREVSVSYYKIGDVLVAQGKVADALKAYRDSLAKRERLASAEPEKIEWQHDLSISSVKVGDVSMSLGKLEDALKAYRDSLAVAERLAKNDGKNAEWQRELANYSTKVGNVLQRQGKVDEALANYRRALAIDERLAEIDQSNTLWQRDLSISDEKVGDILVLLGKLDEALELYQASLVLREQLVGTDKSNTEWQRDRFVSYLKIGDILSRQKRLNEALKSYRDGVAVAELLVGVDRSNTGWQRDLAILHNKIGGVLVAQAKSEQGLKAYLDSLDVFKQLAALDANNTEWQRDVSIADERVGSVFEAQNRLDEALKAYRESLTIRVRLAGTDHSNAQWHRDLSYGIDKIDGLVYRFILAQEFVKALEADDEIIALAPQSVELWINRARVLMFLGRTDDARAIYLRYRDKNVSAGKSWETIVRQDFAEFRKTGLGRPLMEEIEKWFSARQ